VFLTIADQSPLLKLTDGQAAGGRRGARAGPVHPTDPAQATLSCLTPAPYVTVPRGQDAHAPTFGNR